MTNDNGSEFFEEIQPNILNLKEHLRHINSNLEHYNIEPFSRGKGTGSLSTQFQKNPEGIGGLSQVERFIMESIEIVEKLDNYRSHSTLSLEHGKAQRKAERRDAWILWAQRLVRWTIGTAVAVVLYSMVVWASERSDFIKVPIKDWLYQDVSEAKQ